jgi:hypothetical protein
MFCYKKTPPQVVFVASATIALPPTPPSLGEELLKDIGFWLIAA